METAKGIVSHSQNTSRVSGGGNNTSVSTTYIALFRVEQRQVEFSSSSPLPISDGDRVVVAGRTYQGVLYADAIRNATSGTTTHSGIVRRAVLAVVVLIAGLVFTYALTSAYGSTGVWLYAGFLVGAAYLFWRASQTSNALTYVKSVLP